MKRTIPHGLRAHPRASRAASPTGVRGPSRALGAVTLAGLLTLAAACGGDDDGGTAEQLDGDDTGTSLEITIPDELSDVTIPDDLSDITVPDDLTDMTIPDDLSDISIPAFDPSDISIPIGLSDECMDLYTTFAGLFTAMISGQEGASEQVNAVTDELRDKVPDDLQDEVDVLDEAYGNIADLLAEYDNDYFRLATDPEASERLAELDSEEVTAASDAISAHLEERCQLES